MKKCNILGVDFDNITFDEGVNRVMEYFEGEGVKTVFTPNPEMVIEGNNDKELMKILNSASLVIPDGIGIIYGARILGTPLKERVPGCDLIQAVFKRMKDTQYTAYFFGASPEVVKAARVKMIEKYRGLKIVGVSDGYFDKEKEEKIISEIKKKKPDFLLVGLGVPKQEKWISQHMDLPVKVMMGVGGSFDVLSGKTKRAPKIFRKLGLEWFYRLITQPQRFKRQLRLPLFMFKIIISKIK